MCSEAEERGSYCEIKLEFDDKEYLRDTECQFCEERRKEEKKKET